MYELFTRYPVIAIIFMVLIVISLVYLLVVTIRMLGMEKVRKIVYGGILEAEHKFEHGENAKKFEHVVHLARDNLPSPFNAFITEEFLRKTIQLWFKLVKDLLDDGKINNK